MRKMKDMQYGFTLGSDFFEGLSRHDLNEPCESAGIPLAHDGTAIYTDDTDSHTLIFGNTGSKKTRNFCIPGVFSIGMAGESMVVADPKGEIYLNSSGFLKHEGYRIQVLNLRNPEYGSKWNPLALPYHYYQNGNQDLAIEMLTDFAIQLQTRVHCERDVYWENQAADLLVGLALALFECEKDVKKINMESIFQIRKHMQVKNQFLFEIFEEFINTFPEDSLVRYKLDPIYTLKESERTFSCIVNVFDTMTQNFLFNSKIMSMLDSSEIDFDALWQRKTALFLIMPDEKTTYHFLVSVFVKQCYEFLILRAQQNKGWLKKRVNFLLDEFSNFPKISDMPAMISAARSRNIRFLLVVQSRQQLFSLYGDEAETIKSNCRTWIFLSSRELELLNEIMELCGRIYVEGRGEVPLLDIVKLQSLKVGWEESQALVLRGGIRPYVSCVKDFSVYPQSHYYPVPFTKRKKERRIYFSLKEYIYEQMKKEYKDEDMQMDA